MQLKIQNFSLKHTLESGQFFRFKQDGEWYRLSERDSHFRIRQEGDKLEFDGTTKKHIRHLFGLDDNYTAVLQTLSSDKKLKPAISFAKGLRLMNRDPWETLISFQCSVMSNIKKIQLNMNNLAKTFGNLSGGSYSFPEPGKINDLKKIQRCAIGFRAKWVHSVNKMVTDDSLRKLKKKSYADAKQELMKLPGVGSKVADCICLFSLGKKEAFPVDVWIARVMQEQYLEKETKHSKIVEFAQKKWGENAGLAQQFLYHWSRNK